MKNIKHKIVDLDEIQDFQRYEVAVNGKILPIAIGDKIQFPADDPYLKTIIGITIGTDGKPEYVIEWFEDSTFKQNSVTVTELQVLKDNLKQRNHISLLNENNQNKTKSAKTK